MNSISMKPCLSDEKEVETRKALKEKPFDIIGNIKKVFNCDEVKNEISCLYGIRTLLMLYVISNHTIMFRFGLISANYKDFLKPILSNKTIAQMIGFVNVVDTFFVMSAILFVRNCLMDMRK